MLIKGILDLRGSKNASLEQLKEIGECYNIDYKKIQDAIKKEKEKEER